MQQIMPIGMVKECITFTPTAWLHLPNFRNPVKAKSFPNNIGKNYPKRIKGKKIPNFRKTLKSFTKTIPTLQLDEKILPNKLKLSLKDFEKILLNFGMVKNLAMNIGKNLAKQKKGNQIIDLAFLFPNSVEIKIQLGRAA